MRRGIGLLSIGLLVLAACSSDARPFLATRVEATPVPSRTPDAGPTQTDGTVKAASVGLVRFDSCSTLEAHLKATAVDIVGPWGMPGQGMGGDVVAGPVATAPVARGSAVAESAAAQDGAAPQPLPLTGGDEYSGTNVQEAGVDEPDLVKTDGRRIFALSGQTLHAVTPGSPPKLAGSMALPEGWASEMLLHGDRALVFVSAPYAVPMPAPASGRDVAASHAPYSPGTRIYVVDVSDMAKMNVVQTVTLEGDYVSARMASGLARVVVRSSAVRLPFEMPSDGTPRAQAEAQAKNKAIVRGSAAADWLPRFRSTDARGRTTEGHLATCESTYRPAIFSGLGNATVLTIDPRDPRPQESTTVVADAQTVYASLGSMYLATTRWHDPTGVVAREGITTELHRFDISAPGAARYLASGTVPGSLLNQWSLSEHEGHLRVATTIERFNATGGACPPEADCIRAPSDTESVVTVLATRGNLLAPVGSVGGLGRGERIFAVRYMGDVGYVVTFRQIDPLYTLDLSEPAKPRVVGELKIPGYSAYLHPIGPGLLLGVGQDANDQGQILGLQASIFDVSNPAAPKQLHKLVVGRGSSQAEFDHKAFLWWAQRKLAVLPMQVWSERQSDNFSGAIALRADAASGISETGRITHDEHARRDLQSRQPSGSGGSKPAPGSAEPAIAPDYYPQHPIQRSLVIGGSLYTVSGAGLMASDLGSLAERGWVSFVA